MEEYFFFLFFFPPSLHPQEAPQGCPSGPSHADGAAQEGPGEGFSRDGVFQSIPGDDLHLLQRGGMELGDRSWYGQNQIPT